MSQWMARLVESESLTARGFGVTVRVTRDASPVTTLEPDRVIDGLSSEAKSDWSVVLLAERIVWAGPSRELPAVYENGEKRVYRDCTLLPGFVDSHTHFTLFADGRSYEEMASESDAAMLMAGIRNARTHLLSGVTTARDNGSRGDVALVLRDAINAGVVPGPRLLVSGPPVTPTQGHFHWCNGVADGMSEIVERVNALISRGVDHVKIMASGGGTAGSDPSAACYATDEIRSATTTAHSHGALVTAHSRATESIVRAVDGEVDCIEHAEFLDHDGVLRYDAKVAQRIFDKGIYVSPTLQAYGWDRILKLRKKSEEGFLSKLQNRELENLERQMTIRLEQMNSLRNLGMAKFIVSGTDAGCDDFSFGHMDWALQLLVAAGFTEMEALQSATSGAARACGVETEVGFIRSGHRADLLIVEGDPLNNVAAVANVRAVYKGGTAVSLAPCV